MNRILIVDDDPSIHIMLRGMLRIDGYAMDTANGGEQALALLQKQRYDLMLLDMHMEPMGGLQVMAQARELDADLVVIIFTASESAQGAVEAMRKGAFDYLFKTADPEAIRQRVKDGLQKRQQVIERREAKQRKSSTASSKESPTSGERWFRVRYDDQGRDLTSAMNFLDSLAREGKLRVLWVSNHGNLALLVATTDDKSDMLAEGLTNLLPGARIVAGENIDPFLSNLPHRHYVFGSEPEQVVFPGALAQLGSDAALRMEWNRGRLLPLCLMTRENRQKVVDILKPIWAGARLSPFAPPLVGLSGRPSRYFSLPPATYSTLASRNVKELPFSQPHADGLLVGSDVQGRAVRVPRPMRLVWVGDPGRVDNVCAWTVQRWKGQIVVLDASSVISKGWQDIGQANAFVTWAYPGRSAHLNPLARLPEETATVYVERILAWLSVIGITRQVLGMRAISLLRVALRLAIEVVGELDPPSILTFLGAPDSAKGMEDIAAQTLNEEDMAVWKTRDWHRDVTMFAPAISVMRGLFERVPELMALWFPPYTPVETLLRSPWVIVRVSREGQGQRAYWAGMWPLLAAALGRPDVLALGFGLGLDGKNVLGLANKGASALAWGRTLQEAVGSPELLGETAKANLLVGARTDPAVFAHALNIAPAILAAQAADQATARIGGDVGSVRLHLPDDESSCPTGWSTASGIAMPPLVSVMGDEDAARGVAVALLERAAREKRRILAVGNRGLWEHLRELDALFITADDLPMLNPLERVNPRRDAFRWVWWGSGLRLPAAAMQEAYRNGVQTLQDMVAYLQSTQQADEQVLAIIRDALKAGYFGETESDPRAWFERANVIAVESYHPALTRYLAAVALEAEARLVAWHAPGLVASDKPLLSKTHGMIYPDILWVPDVLVARCTNGSIAVLPGKLAEMAGTLPDREAFLYRREQSQHFKVVLQDE